MSDQQLDQVEILLSFRDREGFTTRELWETGLLFLGNNQGEYLMRLAGELFPVLKVSDIAKRNALVAKVIEELNK